MDKMLAAYQAIPTHQSVSFEWSISLGQVVHLVVLLAFLWWLHRHALKKLDKIHNDTTELRKSQPPK